MRRNFLVLLLLFPVAGVAQPGPSDGALAILGLFGLAPHLADQESHLDFAITAPFGHRFETSVFQGLEGVTGPVELRGWGVRPTYLMRGRLVGINVSVQFDILAKGDVSPEVTADQSFSVMTRYHSGVNVAGLLGVEAPVMTTVGLMLDAAIGPRMRLQHSDGSHAQWGRIGEIRFGPSASVAFLGGPVVLHAVGALYPGGLPWEVMGGLAAEASGRFSDADPDGDGVTEIRGDGGYLLSGGAAIALGGRDEPGLSLGAMVALVQRRYDVGPGGFGLQDTFTDRDFRFLLTLGITIPPGH